MGLMYHEDYKVPFYECDVNQNIKLSALLSLALQVSGKQSLSLGMSDEHVFNTYGLVWIVTDYDIEIQRLPHYSEKIRIETEAISYTKLFCYRHFYIKAESGEILLTIHSTFILMDFKTRKVHPVLDEIVAPYQSEKQKKAIKLPKLHPVEDGVLSEFPVRIYDLDMNRHVNNGKYLEWFFDSLGMDFLLDYEPKHIQLKYIKEVHYDYTIQSTVYVENNDDGKSTYHDISGDEGLHARAKIVWKERE